MNKTKRKPGRPKMSPKVRRQRVAASQGEVQLVMTELGLSPRDLARAINAGEGTVRGWINGSSIISVAWKAALASLRARKKGA